MKNKSFHTLNVYYILGISLRILHVLTHLILITISGGRYYYDPDFIDEEMEVQKD